jgi:protoporphyrinogen oxidase
MKNPIIIGAGISGLVAAIELEKAGYSPTILEATDAIGGRVKTDYYKGFPLDHGFQVLLTEYPEAQNYLDYDELELIRFKPGSVIYQRGKADRIGDPQRDFSFAISTLLSGVGSFRDKLLILRLARKLNSKSIEEIFSEPEKSTLQYLQDFGFSDRIIANFFQPFFAGIFLEEELHTSSRMFEFVYRMFGTGYASIPRNGIQAIPQQLADQLTKTTIKLETPVKQIDGKTIKLENSETIEAEQLIIATDPTAFVKGYQKEPTQWKSCYNIYLETNKSTLDETIIGLLPGKDTLVNNFHFLNDVLGNGSTRDIISVTFVSNHSLEESELIGKVKTELKEHCNITTGEAIKVFHIKKALPNICNLSYQPDASAVKLTDGIYCCGDYLANGSLNAAMASGRVAAETLIIADKA